MQPFEVAIVGAGPAGLSAALQLKRYAVPSILFEAGQVGGLLWNANLVENYPGFPGGISGPALVARFRQQVEGLGVNVTSAKIDALSFDGKWFHLAAGEARYQSRIAVIASGTRPVQLSSKVVSEAARERVYSEVYPLLRQRGAHVVIVGAGDAAFDYALNLARDNRVTILNRTATVKCLPILWQRSQEQPGIEVRENTRLVWAGLNANHCLSLKVENLTGVAEIEADLLLAALGRRPNLDFLDPGLERQLPRLETQGLLYRIGDVKNGLYRQTAISVGDGILAAMKIYQILTEDA